VGDWDETTSVATPSDLVDAGKVATAESAYLIVIAGSNVGEMYKVDSDALVLGRSVSAGVRLVDDGISREHCRIRDIGGVLMVEDLDSRNGTFCNGEPISTHTLSDGDKLQLGRTTILKFSYHDKLDESFQKQMLDSALRDALTGAYNRRYFLDRLDSEIRFALRHRSNLSLLILDLDHFKQVNDTYGHICGDLVLHRFCATLQRSIRNEDVLARYGGEEFAIISRSINRIDAQRFAERLRKDTESLQVDYEGHIVAVTTSIGISTVPEDGADTPEELVKAADEALYEAKRLGRNRVCMTPTPE